MTDYDIADQAEYGSEPVELFQFLGPQNLFLTTAQENIIFGGNTYVPAQINHDEIKNTDEITKQTLRLQIRDDTNLLQEFIAGVPLANTAINLYRHIYGLDEIRLLWTGRIVSVSFNANGYAEISCDSIFTTLQHVGLRAHFQRQCRHVLFSPRCGIKEAKYSTIESITAMEGGTIITTPQSQSATPGHYTTGMIHFNGLYRLIIDHSGGKFTISGPLKGLGVGSQITSIRGCQHTFDFCQTVFNNTDNYGGFPFLPDKNPFGNDPVI